MDLSISDLEEALTELQGLRVKFNQFAEKKPRLKSAPEKPVSLLEKDWRFQCTMQNNFLLLALYKLLELSDLSHQRTSLVLRFRQSIFPATDPQVAAQMILNDLQISQDILGSARYYLGCTKIFNSTTTSSLEDAISTRLAERNRFVEALPKTFTPAEEKQFHTQYKQPERPLAEYHENTSNLAHLCFSIASHSCNVINFAKIFMRSIQTELRPYLKRHEDDLDLQVQTLEEAAIYTFDLSRVLLEQAKNYVSEYEIVTPS